MNCYKNQDFEKNPIDNIGIMCYILNIAIH